MHDFKRVDVSIMAMCVMLVLLLDVTEEDESFAMHH